MIKVEGNYINCKTFPNGEQHIETDILNTLLNRDKLKVLFKWGSDFDLMSLYFVLSHIKFNKPDMIVNLYIEYLPYSRMDRDQNGNCFTLKHLAEMLNIVIGENDTVNILEPHSDKSLQLIKNSRRVNVITPLVEFVLAQHPDIDTICYPDKGAKVRFHNYYTKLPVIYCNKVRDFDTGEIKGLEVVTDKDLKGSNIVIVDDLSSKGGTFYHTANKLKELGAKDIYLVICHCEPVIAQGKIYKDKTLNPDSPIKHIYTLDTMLSTNTSLLQQGNMTIYNTERFLDGKFVEV